MMWNNLLQFNNLPALERTIEFTEKRHALLAGNVANMDTPGYQTRDVSVDEFQKALGEAVQADRNLREMNMQESPSYVRSASESAMQAQQKVRDTMNQVLYHDGSDVSLEEQVTEISKNQSMHNMAIALMRSQFKTMQIAISESVNV